MTKPHRIVASLSRARRSQRIAQPRVADHLHVSETTLSNWECGKHEPSLERLDAWAAMHGLRLALVVDEEANS